MSVEENKAIARQLIGEVWSEGNLDVVDEIVAADFVWHNTPFNGAEAFKQQVTAFRADFPDVQLISEDLVAEGDKVVVRLTAQGTHTSTGKRATWTGIAIMRIAGGKIVEVWADEDRLGRFQQLGFELVPPKGESEK